MTAYKIINFGKSFDAGMQMPSTGAVPGKGLHAELVGLPAPWEKLLQSCPKWAHLEAINVPTC